MGKTTQQPESQHITSLNGFLKDVMRLAIFAAEDGQLSDDIQMDELYRMWEIKITKREMLADDDIAYLQHCYQILSIQLAPTTAISLRATENKQMNSGLNYMNTDAGRHVRNMWIWSFAILALIVGTNIYQYMFEMAAPQIAQVNASAFNIANYIYTFIINLIPFMYGAFGACIFILRQAEEQLRERTFDPRRLPEYRNRLVLGTLSGGVIVLLYSSGGSEANIKITEAALGFIGGYSVDLLFSLLDRIVNSLKPAEKTAKNSPPPPVILRDKQYPIKKTVDKQAIQRRKEDKDVSPQLVPVVNKESDNIT
ncbi:hypothetical protein MNBD_GAMMA17-1377 [hydrothermal vent metagenome]|uniref:Uncharacterized protein n=1 Tax=hydrothermal vent metagenome TaxID=652676 RepID=A0A3B0Z4F6_9ZZZZ